MYARNTPAQPAPDLHIAAAPQEDKELQAVKDLLGTIDYTYIYRATSKRFAFQCETYLNRRRVAQDFAAAGITEYTYQPDELDGAPYALVQFNPPPPAPLPVAFQIPARVTIISATDPDALKVNKRGTPDYASIQHHIKAKTKTHIIVKSAADAERRRQQSNKFNVWRHINPTHSAWVRLPNMQRVEAILDMRLIDDTWYYQVDISTDETRRMLKWYAEDQLTGVRRDLVDVRMVTERRRYQNSVAGKVQAAIGQRVHIPTFDAGAGNMARGCNYTIVSIDPDGVTVRHANDVTGRKTFGEVYGELTHHARIQEVA